MFSTVLLYMKDWWLQVGGKKDALGSSNVGHKLLSLMGWAGKNCNFQDISKAGMRTPKKIPGSGSAEIKNRIRIRP